ncbi:hypothetical protein LTR36_006481 [Oleoguttula mirabilis]|uniref:ATPase AAA-type core domain-containing protein n=1 Tax=Oleoguttula mirabilis TaxID=1507867 RepID=A0AAV9JV59_9PEZI|nr:hypothetical protein LTR36_006481 [Oleoguttula mirabilis]
MKRPFSLDAEAEAYKPPPFAKVQRTKPPAAKDLRLAPVFLPATTFIAEGEVDQILAAQGAPTDFSVETLAAGIAQGCSAGAVRGYLESYPGFQVEAGIKVLVNGCHPVLFYALERNCVDCVRLLLEHGCDAKVHDIYHVPALAFAIMRSKWMVVSPTEVVKTLLGFGAQPDVVPSDMWEDYLEPPPAIPTTEKDAKDGRIALYALTLWCESHHRRILAETLNLSVRYFLHKASLLTMTKARGMQLAQAHDYVALLKVPYLVVGQTFACRFVVDHVTSHIGMNIRSPLVLTFAGLSGHGKTEMAKQMGALLKVPITVVDCAQMRSDIGLFGSRSGYHGNHRGSQLNNFLTDMDGARSVVFLDEFDKTDQEVRNSLLLLLDSGEYHDRRTNKPIDATKTIWILATNLGDHAITKFYKDHMEGATETEKAKIPHKLLQNQLKALFRDRFSAAMAGRMKNVAPFYPFDANEQAVVAHKFLSELVDQLRQPIDLSPTTKRYPAHVHLAIKNDGKLCKHIADESYISELGARSLTTGIDDIRRDFYTTFVHNEELVTEEMNQGPLMRYTVQLVPVAGASDVSEVSVVRNGFTEHYRGQGDGSTAPVEDEVMVDGGVEELGDMFGNMMGGKGAVKREEKRDGVVGYF